MTAASFFVPGIAAELQEREYGRLQDCAQRATGCKPAASRIRQLACRIGSLDCTLEVGQPDPTGSGDVVAILDLGRHQPYGVFTTADPEAPAFLVGKRVYAVTTFA
ncbi:MAG: hypothetical protein U0R70_00910 [Solirubrobacteraceae bacterium]